MMIKKGSIKVYIHFKFKSKSGGGNQFLKVLKKYLIKKNIYTENPSDASVIIFNSHHFALDIVRLKNKYKKKIFIQRVDGPMNLYNDNRDKRDKIVYALNKFIADATIFQSKWSFEQNKNFGISNKKHEIIIPNAPDNSFFNKPQKKLKSKKIRIIANSWSTNKNKGFDHYQWIDNNLNFEIYKMCFVGNSNIEFENIERKQPMNSEELSIQLKKSDIYITASRNDPCSNSLIEAIHCGLPVIFYNQGGHPEIVKKGGLGYSKVEEIPALLKEITQNYSHFTSNIELLGSDEVGEKYSQFIKEVFIKSSSAKKFSVYENILIILFLISLKFNDIFKKTISKLNKMFFLQIEKFNNN